MGGFIYNGKSTKSILSDELMLATFDDNVVIPEINRNLLASDRTILKNIQNEYGTTYDNLTISYGLVKKNGNKFTDDEQENIEKWLTSPKMSIDLEIYDDENNVIEIYCGLFTNMKWQSVGDAWIGLMFEFTCNSAYGKKYFKKSFNITSNQTLLINNPSDELEEYVYPTITLLQSSDTVQNISLNNVSDNNKAMSVQVKKNMKTIIDCQHCIIKDQVGLITYEDLGWNDVGNIYWLRLLPGDNQIQVTGNASITIEFEYPCKRIGGWRL